jgi:adenylate cyclase
MDRPFPAYKGNEPYIFVSYAHIDEVVVYPEIRWLQDQGCKVWYDEGISPGSRWSDEVASALNGARALVFFCTPLSSESEHCADEVSYALGESVPTIAVHLKQTELSAGLKLRLDSHQAILRYAMTDEEYRAKLLASISQSGQSMVTTSESGPLDQKTAQTSVAVLPFANMSSDPEQVYFSDGISEEIINALVKTNTVPVIARTSSFKFRGEKFDVSEIGETLRVSHILEGSVRKAGNTVRITAQLVEAASGHHLWSERYDRSLDDIFAIQDEISLAIVEQIQVRLKSKSGVSSSTKVKAAAYDLYLQAMDRYSRLSPGSLSEAVSLLERVVAEDPDFVDGWTALAAAHYYLATPLIGGEPPLTGFALARESVQRALDLDPRHARAICLSGVLTAVVDGQWEDGFHLMEEAVSLSPHDAEILSQYGSILDRTKQAHAEEILQRAYRLDPLSNAAINLSVLWAFEGRSLDAARIVEPMLVMATDNYLINWVLTLCCCLNGRVESAKQYLEKTRTLVDPESPPIKCLQMFVALFTGDVEASVLIQRELANRAMTEVVPYIDVQWPDDVALSIYQNAVNNRDLAVVRRLLGDKPAAIENEDWQELLREMNISGLKQGEAKTGSFRPRDDSEKQKLLDRRIKLPMSYLNKMCGVYKGTVPVILKLQSDQLWLSSPNYESELIPVEENRFEALETNFWYEPVFDADSLQATGLMSHLDQQVVEFTKET